MSTLHTEPAEDTLENLEAAEETPRGRWQRILFGPGKPASGVGGARTGMSPLTRTRALVVVLWALVALGPILGVAALLARRPTAEHPVVPVASATGPQGFAQLYVAAWLTAGAGATQTLAGYYPPAAALDFAQATPGHYYASSLTAIDAHTLSPGYWSVTVAADVLVNGTSGYSDLGVRYYTVGVLTAATTASPASPASASSPGAAGLPAPSTPPAAGYVATGLPTQVSAPQLLGTPRSGYTDDGEITPTDPLGDTLTHFLAAYLTGNGEVDRYTTPAAGLSAVTPAPFTTVTVTDIAHTTTAAAPVGGAALSTPTPGAHLQVLVSAQATDAGGGVQLLQYPINVTAVNGNWQVSGLAAAPTLATTTTKTPGSSPAVPATAGSATPAPIGGGSAPSPTAAGGGASSGSSNDSNPNY